MNKIAFGLAAAALALGASAYAKSPGGRAPDADVTRAEAEARTAEMFARMDANDDGVLDRNDREARQGERREGRFERLDADHDGAISRAEFDAAGDALRDRFAGRRDASEGWGRRGPGRRGFGGPGGPRGMFGPGKFGADTDGDRTITQAEFTAAALERFTRADADHDGTVTAAERRAAIKTFRDQRRAARPDVQS